MMRKRKFLPSALALALCTVLASCGGDGGGGDSGGAAPTATNTPINNSQDASFHNTQSQSTPNSHSSNLGSSPNNGNYNGPDFSSFGPSTGVNNTASTDDPISSISSIDSVHVASGSSVSGTFNFGTYDPKNAAKIVHSLTVTSLGSNDYNYIPNPNYNEITLQKTITNYNYLQNSLKQAFVGFTGTSQGAFNYSNSLIANSLIYFSEGFTPIYGGKNLSLSSLNLDGKVSFASPSTNYNTSLFDSATTLKGSNYRVGMVDGGFNMSQLGGFNPFQLTPIEINLSSIGPEYQGNYEKLSQGENHGLLVGTVISAKRVYGGLVPLSQLYYAQANSNAQRIGRILLETYNQSHPVVINNSYQFSLSTDDTTTELQNIKFNNNPVSDIQRSDNLSNLKELERIANNKSTSIFNSAYAGLKALSTRPDNPLIVFAAGNYHITDQNGNMAPDLKNIIQKAFVGQDQSLINNFVNNPNAGISIDNSFALAQFLADPQVAKDLIVATGVYFDPSHTIALAQWRFKYDNLIAPYRNLVQAANAAGIQPPQVINRDNYKFNQTNYKSNYISAIASYQCGVTKFSCVSVSYQYYYPNQYANVGNGDVANNYDSDRASYYSTGTSFAAPVVAAAAVMLKQQFPWMTASNLKTTLLTTATDVGAPGVDEVFGWGILNVANALRGPQVFAFGDFDANLANRALTDSQVKAGVYNFKGLSNPSQEQPVTKTSLNDSFNFGHNSYFVNSIVGTGGLNVFGKDSDFLYLTGNNKYIGSTTINSGNLVLINPKLLRLGNLATNTDTTLVSQVNVNKQGHFFSYYANLSSNLYNNGQTTLVATNIGGNYIAKPGSVTVLGIAGTTTYRGVNYDTEAVFRPVQVQGTAQLAGTLALTNNIIQAGIEQFIPAAGKTQVLLVADKIDGRFDNKYIPTNDAFKNYLIRYSDDNKAVGVVVTSNTPDEVGTHAAAGQSIFDKKLFSSSTVTVNNLFNEANNDQTVPSSGGTVPGIAGGLEINTNPNILPGFNTGSPQTVTQDAGSTSFNDHGNTSTAGGSDSTSYSDAPHSPGSIGGGLGGLSPKDPGTGNQASTGGVSNNSVLSQPSLASLGTPSKIQAAGAGGQSILGTRYMNSSVSPVLANQSGNPDPEALNHPAPSKTGAQASGSTSGSTSSSTADSTSSSTQANNTNQNSTSQDQNPTLAGSGNKNPNLDFSKANSGVSASAGSDSTSYVGSHSSGSISGGASLAFSSSSGISLSAGKEVDKSKAQEQPKEAKPLVNTQAAVAKIQSYNLQQYKALLYQVGATSYADAQMTSALNNRFLQNAFTDRVGSRFLSPDDSFKAFAQYQHSNTNYKNKDTSVKGKSSSDGGIFGGYAQKGGWNYGFAVTQLNSSWNEKVTIPEYTDQVGKMHPALERALAEATVHTFGTEITVGQAYTDKAFAFSGYFTYHHYSMKRASLSMTDYDQSAKFASYDLGFSGIYTQQLIGDQNMGLLGKVGFNFEDHHTNKVDETATGKDAFAASALSLHADSNDKLGAYVNLGLEGYYNFNLGNFNQKFSAEFNISQSLMPQDYNLKVKTLNGDTIETSNAFKNRFNARIDLNYSIDLAQNINVGVSGHYDYTPNWHDVKADVNLTYSF